MSREVWEPAFVGVSLVLGATETEALRTLGREPQTPGERGTGQTKEARARKVATLVAPLLAAIDAAGQAPWERE